MTIHRLYFRAFIAFLFFIACAGSLVYAQEADPPTPEEPEAPPAATFLIDVQESVDGRESQEHICTYWLRTMLKEAGFRALTRRSTVYDDEDAVAERLEPDEEVQADFVVRGRSSTDMVRKSTFYERDMAFIFHTTAVVELVDPGLPEDEQVLETWTLDEEWGDGADRVTVQRSSLDRHGYRISALVVSHEAVHPRIPEDRLEQVDELTRRIREDLGFPGDTRNPERDEDEEDR